MGRRTQEPRPRAVCLWEDYVGDADLWEEAPEDEDELIGKAAWADEDDNWDDDGDPPDDWLDDRRAATFSTQPDPDDPDVVVIRRASIDEALAQARAVCDRVIVFVDDIGYDAGTTATDPRRATWPPPNLDLRERWYYEPATTARPTHWWVGARFDPLPDPGVLLDLARDLPRVVATRPAERGIELLVEHDPVAPAGAPLNALFDRYSATIEAASDPTPRVPPGVRLRLCVDALLRRKRSYTVYGRGAELTMTHGSPYPADPADIPPAAR
ncbi:MAG: hypothetical protein J7513_14740 [Solirubrobacteraceae bacterium]|nr:hypothetical protein [Solirubrobacteraceae bacterium]